LVNDRESFEEAASLQVLGLAGKEEESLMRDFFNRDQRFGDFARDLGDVVTEALVDHIPSVPARSFLKSRVLAATEPVHAWVVTDPAGLIASISPAFSDLCGYTFDEVRGRKPGSFLQGPGSDPAAVTLLREGIHEKEEVRVEMLNYHKSGSPYWVEITLRPVFGFEGDLEGFEAIERLLSK